MLWVDADAIVWENCDRYFESLCEGADFGAHWFQGPAGGYDFTRNDNRLLSGTLWFNDTPAAKALLSAWVDLNSTLSANGIREGGGQKNLWYLTTCMKDLRIARLPGRYCYVFDKPEAYPDGEPRIIEHTLASRENRGDSKGKVNANRQARLRQIDEALGL